MAVVLAHRLDAVTRYLVDVKAQYGEADTRLGMIDEVLDFVLTRIRGRFACGGLAGPVWRRISRTGAFTRRPNEPPSFKVELDDRRHGAQLTAGIDDHRIAEPIDPAPPSRNGASWTWPQTTSSGRWWSMSSGNTSSPTCSRPVQATRLPLGGTW